MFLTSKRRLESADTLSTWIANNACTCTDNEVANSTSTTEAAPKPQQR